MTPKVDLRTALHICWPPPALVLDDFPYSMVFRSFGNGISIPLVYAWPPHIHHERDTNYSLSYLSVLSSYFRSLKPKACQTRDQEPTCWVGPSSGGGEIILQQRKCEPRLHTRLNCVVEDCLGMSVILRHFFIFIFILTIWLFLVCVSANVGSRSNERWSSAIERL